MCDKPLRLSAVASATAIIFLGTGCATLINSPHQDVPVSTTPPGATITVDEKTYRSPCKIKLARSRDHRMVIERQGYQQETRLITRVPTAATLGNLVLGGLIGFGVDAISGANNRLVPDQIDVRLIPASETLGAAAQTETEDRVIVSGT